MPSLIANRSAKAQRIASALERAHSAEAVAEFGEAYWQAAADRLGEKLPSEETRELVRTILFERERDPFRGL